MVVIEHHAVVAEEEDVAGEERVELRRLQAEALEEGLELVDRVVAEEPGDRAADVLLAVDLRQEGVQERRGVPADVLGVGVVEAPGGVQVVEERVLRVDAAGPGDLREGVRVRRRREAVPRPKVEAFGGEIWGSGGIAGKDWVFMEKSGAFEEFEHGGGEVDAAGTGSSGGYHNLMNNGGNGV